MIKELEIVLQPQQLADDLIIKSVIAKQKAKGAREGLSSGELGSVINSFNEMNLSLEKTLNLNDNVLSYLYNLQNKKIATLYMQLHKYATNVDGMKIVGVFSKITSKE